ncbi:uncharacterized protein [Antedon mediterranea]|uniref:uncharacterized protein n=1 Tax=Antedon mediterranea TaxID=105859 RepID=UPI003AF975BD
MSWLISKVYTTLRGANSSRSTNSSVATTRSFSDADSLDLNCTVSPGNSQRFSYMSYSSADKDGSSCDGWSRPESTAGSIHDSECPDGLIIKLYGEDYIFSDGEYRPMHREPESKRLSTISISCSNQNNENEKIFYGTDVNEQQYEWSDEKEDWITPLEFCGRNRQSKRRSVRPKSENVDEMWTRVMKSVNESFDDEDMDLNNTTFEDTLKLATTQTVSDIAKKEPESDNNQQTVNFDNCIRNVNKEKQDNYIETIEDNNFINDNINNDFIIRPETVQQYIEVDSLPDFDLEIVSKEEETQDGADMFVNDEPKPEDEDEFRSSLAGTSDILSEIFNHFGLPSDVENEEPFKSVESTAHVQSISKIECALNSEIDSSREIKHFEQPKSTTFSRTGSYSSLRDILPDDDVGLFDELECIFTDKQCSLFEDEGSLKESDEISALRKSIEDIVSELDKRTHSELQLKRLRQSLKKLSNFGTRSIKKNKQLKTNSSSVSSATDTDDQCERMHNACSKPMNTQNPHSHETHSSGKNTSTYSDNKGSLDYSFNLNGLDYDQPIEHDSIEYAVTNNIFSAESDVLGKKQIERANTRFIPFVESIKALRSNSDGQQNVKQRFNALFKIKGKHTASNVTRGGEADKNPTELIRNFHNNKDLLLKDDTTENSNGDSKEITCSGNKAGDKLTMVKVQPEFTSTKINRRYRKAFRTVKSDQESINEDIIKGESVNSEYPHVELHHLQDCTQVFDSELGYEPTNVSDVSLTNADYKMGCISVYCKSKSQDTEHSEDGNYYINKGDNRLVCNEENGKYGFENSVLDKDIEESSHEDELESRIAHRDPRLQISLKNDRNKNGMNYILPEIQSVSQTESSYKLGTGLTNDSALSVDFLKTEQADKDDLDSGLECQDEAREEDIGRFDLKHTNELSENCTKEPKYNSSYSEETISMSDFNELLTDRQEYSSEEIENFVAIKSKETEIDDYDKISDDVDSDSFWQEPFEFCSSNSPLSSPCLDDHGKQSATEILELSTLFTNTVGQSDIFNSIGYEMGNSATSEQRSISEDDNDHNKDGFWEVGVKTRRSSAFGTKRGSNRTSQFYVPLSVEEDIIVPQTVGAVYLTPVEDSSTDDHIMRDNLTESSFDGSLQDGNQSDCTSVSYSSSFGIACIYNEDTETVHSHESVNIPNNERVRTEDADSLISASSTVIDSEEHVNVIQKQSSNQSMSAINQAINNSCSKIKHWKSVDGMVYRLNEDSKRDKKLLVSLDPIYDRQTLTSNMNEDSLMNHEELNNNCNKNGLTLKSSEVVLKKNVRVEEMTVNEMETTNSNGLEQTIECLEDEWQRNRLLRKKKRDDMKKREQALQDKVDWVRDEIKNMKELDKKLMDQFFELRSVIHKMTFSTNRPIRDLNISDLDEEDAFYEDAEIVEFDKQCIPAHEQYIPAFRGRTVSMMTPPSERRLKLWPHNRRMPSFTSEDDVPLDMLL